MGLGSTVILPITTHVFETEPFPLRAKIPSQTCGLEKESELLINQILAWDNVLFKKELGLLPEYLQDKVKSALLNFLDLA